MKLSIIIPCYDEEKNLPLILERFADVIDRDDIEVLLVDNGSTDNSPAVLKTLLAKPEFQFARSLRIEVNAGYGHGILSGLQATKADYIGWTHADMQTDPKDVIRALDIIEAEGSPQNIYVKGKRQGRPLFDQFFTICMSFFESVYLGYRLWDINAQPNIFHRSFFKQWHSPPNDFSLDLYALYMAKVARMNIYRIPVVFPPRQHGESHWNTSFAAKWKFIKRTFEFSFKLKAALKN